MYLSTAWLNADYGLSEDTQELAKRLTMAGLEVDGIHASATDFTNVLIGEVTALSAHPDADKLRVATVSVGGEPLQIVCGAPNVAQGVKVPVAMIGATLPMTDGSTLTIKKSKLRGVESYGMLCSARELGMSEDHSGLLILPEDAPVGMNIREYLQLDDDLIDIDLTPNRADAFSIRGLARETALLFERPFTPPAIPTVDSNSNASIAIQNLAPQDCPQYCARVITGVNNQVATPIWLAERLRRMGIRPHDPLVDITNYVMIALGTPMHAFDGDKIQGGITIRHAQTGETLKLINENTATLAEDILLIADDHQPLAIAGVMGGLESGCSRDTHTVILESAWFNPVTIAGKARRFALSSDSAQRFERGVDYTLQTQAIELATQLILDICGGQAGEIVQDTHPEHLPQRLPITLSYTAIGKRIGREYERSHISRILNALGCQVSEQADSWTVTPPSWRFDLEIAEDLIEEIARVDGYANIPDNRPQTHYQKDQRTPDASARLSDQLVALGFQEAITYSFIDRRSQSAYFGDQATINLQNPISAELAEMRLSLIPGLVNALVYNRNRQQTDVRLFETGRVFLPQGERAIDSQQEMRIAGVISGLSYPEQWGIPAKALDFFDLKGIVDSLLNNPKAQYHRSDKPYLHPGQSAEIRLHEKTIGYLGALHPQTLKTLGIKGGDIWVFELSLDAFATHHTPRYQAIGKYPSVRRDLALIVDKTQAASELEQTIREHGGEHLRKIIIFDRYQGNHLPENKQSLAIGLIWQNEEKTLQDEEVEDIISHLIHTLRQKHGAELR